MDAADLGEVEFAVFGAPPVAGVDEGQFVGWGEPDGGVAAVEAVELRPEEGEGGFGIAAGSGADHAGAGVADGGEKAGDFSCGGCDEGGPDVLVVFEEMEVVFFAADAGDLVFESDDGREVGEGGGTDVLRVCGTGGGGHAVFRDGEEHVLIDADGNEAGFGIEGEGVEIAGAGDETEGFFRLVGEAADFGEECLGGASGAGLRVHDAEGPVGFTGVVEAGGGDASPGFRDEAAAGVEGFVGFGEDPAVEGVGAEDVAAEVFPIPGVGGAVDQAGDVVPLAGAEGTDDAGLHDRKTFPESGWRASRFPGGCADFTVFCEIL